MREVRQRDWAAFCQRLNQFENGANVTVDVLDQSGTTRESSRLVFEQISFDARDACSDRLTIQGRAEEAKQLEIIEPIHVRLNETEGGAAFNRVLIEGEEGTTVLTFHPVVRRAWMEGLDLQ